MVRPNPVAELSQTISEKRCSVSPSPMPPIAVDAQSLMAGRLFSPNVSHRKLPPQDQAADCQKS